MVEVLKSEVTDIHVFKDRNLHETLPLLPFWKHDVVIHAVSVLDIEKKEVTIKADNYKAEHDFFGFKSKWTEWHTSVKTLPSPYYDAGGNNSVSKPVYYRMNANNVLISVHFLFVTDHVILCKLFR